MKHIPLKRFPGNQSGSILLLVGLSFLFLVGIAGAGYDLGRQQLVRQKMQQASDAAALAAANLKCEPDGNNQCENRRKLAVRYYNLNFPETYLGVTRPQPTITVPANGPVTVDASTQMDTQFVVNLGFEHLDSIGHTKVNPGGAGAPNLDVLLMLDTSGSMKEGADGVYPPHYPEPSKMSALQQAATTLSHLILDSNVNHSCLSSLLGCNRIAVLPYSLGAPVYTMYQNPDCNCMHTYSYTPVVCCTSGGCTGGPPGGGHGEGDASDIFGKKFFAGLGNCLIGDAKASAACTPTGCGGNWSPPVRHIATCNYLAALGKPICTSVSGSSANCNLPSVSEGCTVTGDHTTPQHASPDSNGDIWGCFPDALVYHDQHGDHDQMNYCEEVVNRNTGGDCKFHPNYSSDYPLGYDTNIVEVLDHLPRNPIGKTNSGDAFRAAMDPAGIPPFGNATATPLVLLPHARTPDQGAVKVVIWVTDGDNTAWTNQNVVDSNCTGNSNSPDSCTGHINFGDSADQDNLWGGGWDGHHHQNPNSDEDTRAFCDKLNRPTDGSKPVIVYTIGFGVDAARPNSRAYNLLKYCASTPDKFMVAPDAATLQEKLPQIFDDLNKIRITE